jgi:hypothetical protein
MSPPPVTDVLGGPMERSDTDGDEQPAVDRMIAGEPASAAS